MTLRENAQFIDELRQHYRRLDGFLVSFRDRVSTDELWDVNLCVLALRRLLFGGIGDPNFPPSPEEIEKRKLGAASAASPVKLEVVRYVPLLPVDEEADRRMEKLRAAQPLGRKRRITEDAPTAPMSVHDPAEDLEVIP